jgi:hypothetical protein
MSTKVRIFDVQFEDSKKHYEDVSISRNVVMSLEVLCPERKTSRRGNVWAVCLYT